MKFWGERNRPQLTWRHRAGAIVILLLLVTTLVLSSQNCAKVRLQVQPEPLKMPERSIQARVCPQPKLESINNAKFIFVIDMSRSNLGNWRRDTSGASYWDKSVATDLNGQRMDALDGFVQSVSSSGSGNLFSVISFSNQAGRPAIGSTGTTFDCNPSFGNASTARQSLAELKTLNTSEYRDIYEKYETQPWQGNDPAYDRRIMRATSYSKALECSQNLLQKDLAANAGKASTYIMIFITDGKPQEEENVGCENQPVAQRDACYLNESVSKTRTLVQSAVFMNSTMRVQPIFYGAAPPPPTVLTEMAKVGRVTEAISVANVDQLASLLGGLVSQPQFVDFQIDYPTVTNLNAKVVNKKLAADSEADGITDDIELKNTFCLDNDRCHTTSLLDGVCDILGGPGKCTDALKGTACSSAEKQFGNNLGLSDCDIRALDLRNLESLPDYGVDTDHDGVPDFLEVVKGLNLFRNDMTEDPDKDGLSNRAELLRGSNPNEPDPELDDEMLIHFTQTRLAPSSDCATGEWQLQVSKLPTVEVPRYQQTLRPKTGQAVPRAFLDLSHGTDENVILLTYTLRPQNSALMPAQLWGTLVRVPHKLPYFNMNLSTNDFVLIGETK